MTYFQKITEKFNLVNSTRFFVSIVMPGSFSGFQGFCEIFCLGSTFFLVLLNQFHAIPCLHPSKFKETSGVFWQVQGV